MIVSINVSHFVKNLSTILHQLICRSVANFGTRCSNNKKNASYCNINNNKHISYKKLRLYWISAAALANPESGHFSEFRPRLALAKFLARFCGYQCS